MIPAWLAVIAVVTMGTIVLLAVTGITTRDMRMQKARKAYLKAHRKESHGRNRPDHRHDHR